MSLLVLLESWEFFMLAFLLQNGSAYHQMVFEYPSNYIGCSDPFGYIWIQVAFGFIWLPLLPAHVFSFSEATKGDTIHP